MPPVAEEHEDAQPVPQPLVRLASSKPHVDSNTDFGCEALTSLIQMNMLAVAQRGVQFQIDQLGFPVRMRMTSRLLTLI